MCKKGMIFEGVEGWDGCARNGSCILLTPDGRLMFRNVFDVFELIAPEI